jgi:hypothetical protein
MPGQQGTQQAGPAGQGDPGAVLASRCYRPGDDLAGCVVPAHGIDGDQRLRGALPVGRLRRGLLSGGLDGRGLAIAGRLPRRGGVRFADRLPVASRRSMAGVRLFRAPHAAKLLTAPAEGQVRAVASGRGSGQMRRKGSPCAQSLP